MASALLGGCGSATSTTLTRAAATQTATTVGTGAPTTTATRSTDPSPATTIPAGVVAISAGRPITRTAFDHWMHVVAKSDAAQTPGVAVITPTDPPLFNDCIAQARRQIPTLAKSPTPVLRADCRQLFRSLSPQVMGYLIKAYWYEAEAAKLGITPAAAQVQRAFETQRRRQFPTASGFQKFLSQTGQTQADILFRFRISLTVTRLEARETGTQAARIKAVDQLVTNDYRATTLCTPTVMMADCGQSA